MAARISLEAIRHRVFKFTLRFMFTSITGLCILLGCQADRAINQRRSTAALREMGAIVTYDWHPRPKELEELRERDRSAYLYSVYSLLSGNSKPPGPKWLRRIVGDDYFQTVVGVQLPEDLTDDGCRSAIRYLRMLRSLSHVSVTGSAVTDHGVAYLVQLRGLSSMSLDRTNVTNKAIESVVKLPNLKSLYLDSTSIGDDSIQILVKAHRLKHLSVAHTRITADGIESLAQLRALKVLDVSGLPVDDRSLSSIGKLTSLTNLNLGETRISDRSLALLYSLRNLRQLNVSDTEITQHGAEALGWALPKCQINENSERR